MKLPLCSLLLLSAIGLFAADEKPALAFKDTREKISYSLGADVGNRLKMQGADVDVDVFINGLRDGYAGKSKLTDAEQREVLIAWGKEMREKRTEKMKAEGETNRKEGEAWLAANAKKPEVKMLAGGLQYKVMIPGTGPQPKAGDNVSAHYRGTLINGTQFDSSYERGQPLTTSTLGGVIPGWLEALTNMHVGDKWELYIPNQLAYGDQARGKIPAGATLIFELELLGINPSAPAFPSLNSAPGTPQIKVAPAPGATPQIKVTPSK